MTRRWWAGQSTAITWYSSACRRDRIALGYNAVDNDYFANRARLWRESATGRSGLPAAAYFLTVCRFAPEKNLVRLIGAFARYRQQCNPGTAWDLVALRRRPTVGRCSMVRSRGAAARGDSPPRLPPGRCASALVRPRRGVRAGEPFRALGTGRQRGRRQRLAASGLRARGCATTLVPEPEGTTGGRFDPLDVEEMTTKTGLDGGSGPRRSPGHGPARGRGCFTLGTRPLRAGVIEALGFALAKRAAAVPLKFDGGEEEISR